MAKLYLCFLFVLITICSYNPIQAQQTININKANSDLTPSPILKSQYNVENLRQFKFNPELKNITKNNTGDTLLLDFFENKRYKAIIKNITQSEDGIIGITSQILNTDFGYCYMSVSDKGVSITANIPLLDEQYFAGDNCLSQHKISETQKNALKGSDPLIPPTTKSATPINLLSSCTDNIDDDITLDVMVVYTAAAAKWAEDEKLGQAKRYPNGIHDIIDISMQMSNESMRNSLTGIQFNLVHKHQTDYIETNSSKDLERFAKTGDGFMDDVHTLRTQYKADLIVLLANVEYTGGQAYVLNSDKGNREWCSFSLSRVQQSSWTYTVVHEIGHNMGCGHHKEQNVEKGPALYPYSAGWRGITTEGTKYSTIMTYEEGEFFKDGQYHPRIPYFSSPEIVFEDVSIGDINDGNNVLTLKRTKHVTSRYEAKPILAIDLDSLSKQKEEIDPPFTYSSRCGELVPGDIIETNRFSGEDTGIYPIKVTVTRGGIDVTHEYEFYAKPGALTIEALCSIANTDQTTICLNTPFIWHDIAFNTSTTGIKTKVKTFAGWGGCDSIVTFTLTVEPIPSISLFYSINSFCPESNEIEIEYEASDNVNELIITFDNDAKNDGFIDMIVLYDANNKIIKIPVPNKVKEKKYNLTITPTNNICAGEPVPLILDALKPATNIIMQKWNDVLFCNNKDGNYTSYQWYRDGEIIPRATEQFYQVKQNFDALYHVVLTTKRGEKIVVCPVSLVQKTPINTSSVILFPNPVNAGDKITIKTGLAETDKLEEATITLYNSNGVKEKSLKITGEIATIDAPNQAGIYLIIIQSKYGTQTSRFLVK